MKPKLRVRLQKYLASCGVASRRAAEDLIRERRVKVNGKVISELGFTVASNGSDKVEVDGREVRTQELGILLLHKPKFVVSTLSDPEGRPALDKYLTKKYSSYFPVGRLDWESEGLVILTNDGELADYLLHPRYQIPREYQVILDGYFHDRALNKLKSGVLLEDGVAKALKVKLLDREEGKSSLNLMVTEGRNRLVRRMFQNLGFEVTSLLRLNHGPFRLGRIRKGEVQKLTEREYQSLRRKVIQSLPQAK